jgi:predicted AAA+ superfamily ATPase
MKTFDIHKKSEEELLNVFRRLIYHGENNSALLIGPRGSGKTTLIKQVLESLRHELKEKNCSDDMILVNLSGF